MSERTVMINGTAYDAVTGMPVHRQPSHQSKATPAVHSKSEIHHSHSVHNVTQKSQTLNRRIVKNTPHAVKQHPQQARPRMDIQKNPAITKFAPHPQGAKTQPKPADIGPMAHPVIKKAEQRMEMAKKPVAMAPKPAQMIKQEAVAEALQNAPSHSAATHEVKHKKRYPRALSIASASLALLLLGGYFTYLNMPSLSTRVAAAQADINASYPSYRPDGYSLKGAVAYAQHQVNMTFKSNSGPQAFTIDQTKSSWDSSAVLENYVSKKVGDNYIAYNERGLTIYTFGGNAAWVNGGILYTINGDAPLSGDQIRHIATSM